MDPENTCALYRSVLQVPFFSCSALVKRCAKKKLSFEFKKLSFNTLEQFYGYQGFSMEFLYSKQLLLSTSW